MTGLQPRRLEVDVRSFGHCQQVHDVRFLLRQGDVLLHREEHMRGLGHGW